MHTVTLVEISNAASTGVAPLRAERRKTAALLLIVVIVRLLAKRPRTMWSSSLMITQLEYITDGKRHLVCLPYSIENLHLMANELGIKRCWFHSDHYDIPKRRIKEIEEKCRKVSSKESVLIIKMATIV
jgi:hypothetical protein